MSPGRATGDRGDATTQLVLLTPVVLVLVLLVVQMALWFHAANVATAAATRAVAVAAEHRGSPAAGASAATTFAAEAGVRLGSTPTVTRSGGVASAAVEVRLVRLLPGLPVTVTRQASAPVERFLAEPDR